MSNPPTIAIKGPPQAPKGGRASASRTRMVDTVDDAPELRRSPTTETTRTAQPLTQRPPMHVIFGGGCLPKDIRALLARGEELGLGESLAFLREVDATNTRRRHLLVRMASEECAGVVTGRRIAVLGAAFKPQTDDVRDSPALHVADALRLAGAEVAVYDPQANANAARAFPDLTYRDCVEDAVRGAHLVLHLTEWPEFRSLEPRDLRPLAAEPRLIDGRNSLDPDRWRQAGWSYRAPGRPMLAVDQPAARRVRVPARRVRVPARRVRVPSQRVRVPVQGVADDRSEARSSQPRTRDAETQRATQ